MMKHPPSQIGFQCFPRKFKLLRGLVQAVMKRVRSLTYISTLCAFVYLSRVVGPSPEVFGSHRLGYIPFTCLPVILDAYIHHCSGTVSYSPLNTVFVCLGCCNKVSQAGRLKPQKFVSYSSGG